MNYDKLSRSLRYYYEKGIMSKGKKILHYYINCAEIFGSDRILPNFGPEILIWKTGACKDKIIVAVQFGPEIRLQILDFVFWPQS